jgi:SAM-dependent methyltransferase
LEKLRLHGLEGKRLFDVACGTGKSFIPMIEWGYEVTACDISAAMVKRAGEKVGEAAKLSVADMRELPALGEFDLIWCLDDAINYLLGPDELERALAGMRSNLAPGGLLLFDANTIDTYRSFFTEEVVVEREGRRLIWRGMSGPDAEPGSINEARFEVEAIGEQSGQAIAPQMHRQRHFPEAEMLAAIERAGLKPLDVFGHDARIETVLEQPLDEAKHTKAIYIAGLP